MIDAARSAVELLLRPLDSLPPWLSIAVVSIVTGVIALVAVKYTTNQKKVELARDRMSSTIYEMRLFIDSPRRVLSAQARLVLWSIIYTGRTLPALALLAAPLILVYLHLELRHSYAPAHGQALVEVVADGPVTLKEEGLGPIVDGRSTWFRIPCGRSPVTFEVGGERHTKELACSGASRISVERLRGLAGLIAFGYEPALPADGKIERITVQHERVEREVFWMPWWLTWMVLSIAVALPLRKPLRVAI